MAKVKVAAEEFKTRAEEAADRARLDALVRKIQTGMSGLLHDDPAHFEVILRQLNEISAEVENAKKSPYWLPSSPPPGTQERFVQKWTEGHPGASPEEAEREFERAWRIRSK